MSDDANYTTQVYYDEQDPQNLGWAYRCDAHGRTGGRSGSLEGFESESTLTREEAIELARLALEEDTEATHVRVYWHGEQDPITFAAAEVQS